MKNIIPYYINNQIKIINYEKVIVSKYHEITLLSSNKIRLTNYEIIGTELEVVRLDDYEIEIKGKITQIIILSV